MRNGNSQGLGSWLGLGLGSGLVFYFAALLCNFSPFRAFRIVQMRNAHDINITVENLRSVVRFRFRIRVSVRLRV